MSGQGDAHVEAWRVAQVSRRGRRKLVDCSSAEAWSCLAFPFRFFFFFFGLVVVELLVVLVEVPLRIGRGIVIVYLAEVEYSCLFLVA